MAPEANEESQIPKVDPMASFASFINVYEHRIGHVTRNVATHLPDLFTSRIPLKNAIILDNACGIGAVTDTFIEKFPSAQIYAMDSLPAMIDSYKASMTSKWQKEATNVAIMDSQELSYPNDFFDLNIMNFGIYFLPDPAKGVKEMYRTLKPGGIAVVTVWKEFGFQPILWEVQRRIGPANALKELPVSGAWADGQLLRKNLVEGGFDEGQIEMKSIEASLCGTGVQDFQKALLENFSAMVARFWSDEEKAQLERVTAEVLEDGSAAEFYTHSGENFKCPMVAWAAVCKKPGS